MWYDKRADISELKGQTLIRIDGLEVGDPGEKGVTFITASGASYRMFHSQGCCESVYIEDVIGDVSDLIGSEILVAEEVSSDNEPPKEEGTEAYSYVADSYTWTFYRLGTIKGSVTIRWYGTSNGYYSESVDFIKLTK